MQYFVQSVTLELSCFNDFLIISNEFYEMIFSARLQSVLETKLHW